MNPSTATGGPARRRTRPSPAGLLHRVGIAVVTGSVLAAAGCSTGSTASPGASSGSSTGSGTSSAAGGRALEKVWFINPAPAQEHWQIAQKCFENEATKKGLQARSVGVPSSGTSAAAQLELIQQAVAAGADGIAGTSFAGAEALEPAFAAAKEKGVLVATMESGDATKARTFDVGLDIVKFAKDMVDQVASRPGKHRAAILAPGLSGTPKIFADAARAQAKAHDNVEITELISDDGAVAKDADLMSNLLTAHPMTTDILAVNPGSTAGVVTAIRERGRIGEVFLTGNGLADPAREALTSGAAAALYVQQICDVGTLAVDTMVAASKGEKVDRVIPVKTDFATKKNIDSLGKGWV